MLTYILYALIPIILFLVIIVTLLISALTYASFVWKSKGLMLVCVIYWVCLIFGIGIAIIKVPVI
jgi:hypothetical protein